MLEPLNFIQKPKLSYLSSDFKKAFCSHSGATVDALYAPIVDLRRSTRASFILA